MFDSIREFVEATACTFELSLEVRMTLADNFTDEGAKCSFSVDLDVCIIVVVHVDGVQDARLILTYFSLWFVGAISSFNT